MPHDFPAGLRQISVHVQSENQPTDFALGSFSLFIADRPLVSLALDPVTITGGKAAQFGMVVVNKGNAAVDVAADAVDPEELAQFEFEPAVMHLLPGEQQVVHMEDEGRAVDYAMGLIARSWGFFGDFQQNMRARQDEAKVTALSEQLSRLAPKVVTCPQCGAPLRGTLRRKRVLR